MDAFREELLEKCGKDIDLIRKHLKGYPSREFVADMIIRSVGKTKNGASIEDSPIYKVCKYLDTHSLNNYKNNVELRKDIEKITKISPSTLASIFERRNLILPIGLEYIGRSNKKKKEDNNKKSKEGLLVEKERGIEKEKSEIVIPATIKELCIKTTGFELVLKFV